jgi:hypothetical protein
LWGVYPCRGPFVSNQWNTSSVIVGLKSFCHSGWTVTQHVPSSANLWCYPRAEVYRSSWRNIRIGFIVRIAFLTRDQSLWSKICWASSSVYLPLHLLLYPGRDKTGRSGSHFGLLTLFLSKWSQIRGGQRDCQCANFGCLFLCRRSSAVSNDQDSSCKKLEVL